MLRTLRRSDLAVVQDLVVAAAMFTAEEAGFLEEEAAFGRYRVNQGWGRRATVHCEHDLTMIAVDPERQGGGIGHELLRHVEVTLGLVDRRR